MTSLPSTTTTSLAPPGRPEGLAIRPGLAPPAAGGMSLSQLVSVLLRHIWLILAVFVLVTLITWGIFGACWYFAKEYTARGLMQVMEQRTITVDPREPRPEKYSTETLQREQATRITSEYMVSQFLGQPEADPRTSRWLWVQQHRTDRDPLVQVFMENISASPVRDSRLVEIRLSDRNPVAAAEILNELMSYYAGRTRMELESRTQRDRRAINQEMDKVQFTLTRVNQNLADLRRSKEFEGLERARAEAVDRVAQLVALETNLLVYRDQYKQSVEALKARYLDDPNPKPSVEIVQAVEAGPLMQQLMHRRNGLLEDRANLLSRGLGPNHQVVKEVDVRIEEVEAAIRDRRKELTKSEMERTVNQAFGQLTAVEVQLKSVQTNLADAKDKKWNLENMWAQYRTWLDEKTQNEREMDRLRGLIRDIDVMVARGVPLMEVFSGALPPRRDQITFPRWEVFLAIGLVLGVGLGVGLAVLIEMIDTSVRTPRDISEQARLPLLGFVPLVADETSGLSAVCRLAMAEPMSIVAESFRQIRTNLLFAVPVDQLSSLAVTSAAAEEGKTMVATNLAITIALSGRRVLLVDANFRRPALASVFNLSAPVGLSNVLTNQAQFADAVRPAGVPNLAVVASGPTPPNPAELMGSATMRTFLDQAAAEYDLVVFDCPPALLVSDALVLGGMVDGVLAVVRAGRTSRGMAARLRDQLQKVNARIVGAVLNAARPTRGGYFRKSQRQYEEYHSLQA